MQPNIFGNRNFAQTVAYFRHPSQKEDESPLLTINRYSPGFSYEIERHGGRKLSSEEALIKTKLMSEQILDLSDKSIDRIYDDLHFLSSKKHSIDIGGTLFQNLGNILYSAKDQRLFIIDLQPFIYNHQVNPQHTKGFNCPLFLSHGLLPGIYRYSQEHSKDKTLIELRTGIIDKIISGAERNNLSDVGCYMRGDANRMKIFWRHMLNRLNIPEKHHDNFIDRVTGINDKERYRQQEIPVNYQRVSGSRD